MIFPRIPDFSGPHFRYQYHFDKIQLLILTVLDKLFNSCKNFDLLILTSYFILLKLNFSAWHAFSSHTHTRNAFTKNKSSSFYT